MQQLRHANDEFDRSREQTHRVPHRCYNRDNMRVSCYCVAGHAAEILGACSTHQECWMG